MTRETFTVTVEVLNCIDKETAIATAASYLAYCDMTDTIGYEPNYVDTEVHTDGDGPIAVTLHVELNIAGDSHLSQLMEQFADMSKVLAVERSGVVLP
jgi:hypothetical protein